MLCEQQAYSPFSSLSQAFPHGSCYYSQQIQPQSPSYFVDEPNFDDLIIVKKLNKANFPVFLTYSPSHNSQYAMKVFPFQKDGNIKPNFLNEIRFTPLKHSNVISIVEYQSQKTIMLGENQKDISFILMELAPYGDFFDMIMTHQIPFNEKIARTYFHQLIEGLEYLHFQGVAHLDIKLENLLVGQDFQLKIADFDNACINGQSFTSARGTAFYRAPELINGTCQDGYAADIYSAAIILFLFKSGGVLPHSENKIFRGMNLFDMMNRDNRNFWQKHAEIQNKSLEYFDEDFKALFNSMTRFHPSERISLEQIKKSNWYNGPVFTNQELAFVMNQLYPNA